MKADRPTAIVRRASVGLIGFALAGSLALVSAPAEALPAPGPGVPCVRGTAGNVPAARQLPDTSPVTARTHARIASDLAEASRVLADRTPSATARTAALPVYRVKVQIHVIHGHHKRERKLSKRGARRKVFRVLRNAYNGSESTSSEPMGIDFDLKRITVTQNDRWYHAEMMSRADRQMKRTLHRGRASTLNIYVNKPAAPRGAILLGYSRFPWQYRGHRSLDGVTINVRSLPGGNAWGYNLGDSVVHETGHWLGLLHTFQDNSNDQHGCDPKNDLVTDTPAEKGPNFRCADPTNLCDPNDALVHGYYDPAYNFMDYTFDACMRLFTLGQHSRVVQMFHTYRAGR